MSGVYGDMLAAFPELLKEYQVFRMEPHAGGGYGPRTDERTVRGYMSWRKGGKMGNDGGNRMENERGTFWEQHDFAAGKSRIEQGEYLEARGKVLLLMEDDDFGAEGRFSRWLCQLVAANDGTQVIDGSVNLGERDFA